MDIFAFSVIIFALGYSSFVAEEISYVDVSKPPHHYDPPPDCPPNELYKHCLVECSNCQQRGRCFIRDCSHRGCDCLPHFVRLTPGGPCESVSQCPRPMCGENEEFRACGPMCETCTSVQCRVLHCEYRCYCREGYMKNDQRKCIPKAECPPKRRCSRGEIWNSTGPEDEFCMHSDTEVVSNATQEKEMCYCKPDLMRNSMGHCMDENFCPVLKCLGKEVYDPCPKKCNVTCRNYGDPTCEENGDCFPGCFCPEGYLMNDHRACVRLEDCPPGSNPFVPTAAPTTEGEGENMTTNFDQTISTPLPTTLQDQITLSPSTTSTSDAPEDVQTSSTADSTPVASSEPTEEGTTSTDELVTTPIAVTTKEPEFSEVATEAPEVTTPIPKVKNAKSVRGKSSAGGVQTAEARSEAKALSSSKAKSD